MALFANKIFLTFLGLYIFSILTLILTGVFSPAEPLFMLAIFGLLLPGVAYFLSRKAPGLTIPNQLQSGEVFTVFILILMITAYLVWGKELLDILVYSFFEKSSRVDFFVDLIKKVLVFVLIPYFIFSRFFGYSWKDFGFSSNFKVVFAPRTLLLMGVMFVLYFLVQFLVGQGAQPIFQGEFPLGKVLLGFLILYPLLVIEVGLVEEFFFRGIVQTRMAIWLKSDVAGIFAMALIFGLAHVPGLYFRGSGGDSPLGGTPTFISTFSYSIAILSLAGLAFGIIWAKTKNMVILMLIHAWVDVWPLLPGIIRNFGV